MSEVPLVALATRDGQNRESYNNHTCLTSHETPKSERNCSMPQSLPYFSYYTVVGVDIICIPKNLTLLHYSIVLVWS